MLFFLSLDAPQRWQFGFQDPATPIMEGIIELHHIIFFFLIWISTLVFWMLFKILISYSYQADNLYSLISAWFCIIIRSLTLIKNQLTHLYKYNKADRDSAELKNLYETIKTIGLQTSSSSKLNLAAFNNWTVAHTFNHSARLEIVWVILPAIVLIFIALPSFSLLYSIDEIFDPKIILKITGFQWYWGYEYPAFNGRFFKNTLFTSNEVIFDSRMVFESDLINYKDTYAKLTGVHKPLHTYGVFRILETDVEVFLPVRTHIQALVTSYDVIHSWAIPSLGVKIDAVPGRLNQVGLFIKREGIFYGQCSEICGLHHGFMPIKIIAVTPFEFFQKVSKFEQIQDFLTNYRA